jgi:hypothetical protein
MTPLPGLHFDADAFREASKVRAQAHNPLHPPSFKIRMVIGRFIVPHALHASPTPEGPRRPRGSYRTLRWSIRDHSRIHSALLCLSDNAKFLLSVPTPEGAGDQNAQEHRAGQAAGRARPGNDRQGHVSGPDRRDQPDEAVVDGTNEIKTRRLNPGAPISPGATAVHKITDADVAGRVGRGGCPPRPPTEPCLPN